MKVLSISIAAYNAASTLRECLDPFLKSNVLKELDIMVVDDGSGDNTAEIAEEYHALYPGYIPIDKKGKWWMGVYC